MLWLSWHECHSWFICTQQRAAGKSQTPVKIHLLQGVALSLLSSQLPAVRRTGCKPCRPDVPFLMDDCLQAYLALMTALYQYSLMDCSIMQSSACRCMSLSSRSSGYQFCARMCQPGLGRGGVAGADSSTPSAGEIV